MNLTSTITREFIFTIFGVLVVASSIGFVLGKFAKTDGAKSTVLNLNARINSWWIMVIVVIGALASGKTVATMMFAIISFLALREFITATPTRRADHRSLFFAFFLVLPLQYWLVHIHWYGLFVILIPVYAFVLLPVLMVLRGDATDFLERAARTQWGLMICVFFISHIPMILHLNFPPLSLGKEGLILFLVIVVQGSDVLQYVWGKLCGRHPVAPTLSPKKTWEGLVLGILSSSALGASLHWLTPCNAWQAFVMALLLCTLGFFGGLVLSAIKRARGIKDWGTLIEGHGGMMDRIDSLCFSAPLYFHLMSYFFNGTI